MVLLLLELVATEAAMHTRYLQSMALTPRLLVVQLSPLAVVVMVVPRTTGMDH
jgi:hypothetical protein